MKIPGVFAVIFAALLSCLAETKPEDFSPCFSTNTPILWQAPTNQLPKSFWIYKRLPPRPFPAAVISNAITLASLENKISPVPSTNDFFYHEAVPPNYPGMIPEIFCITPKSATISYSLPHPGTNTASIPADKILVQRAWACAAQLGVDPVRIVFKEMTARFNQDKNNDELTNQRCGRGVFLSRKLAGLLFWSDGAEGGTEDGSIEGFWIEFGSYEQVRGFSLVWPDLQRGRLQPTASLQQIIACIRAQKTIVLPDAGEKTYFRRIKALAEAKTFTITKITPYYNEGVLGETPPMTNRPS